MKRTILISILLVLTAALSLIIGARTEFWALTNLIVWVASCVLLIAINFYFELFVVKKFPHPVSARAGSIAYLFAVFLLVIINTYFWHLYANSISGSCQELTCLPDVLFFSFWNLANWVVLFLIFASIFGYLGMRRESLRRLGQGFDDDKKV